MDVHKNLGKGFNKIIYKDTLEHEFRLNSVSFERAKELDIYYKNYKLQRKYISDFVLINKIIFEAKAIEKLD